MSHPQSQPSVKPAGAATFDPRRLPTAWFLCDVACDLPAYGLVVGGNAYVSRTESGLYRVLRKGVAALVTEGVARRHFRRVVGSDGLAVRVSQQARWDETWYEAMAESRRVAA